MKVWILTSCEAYGDNERIESVWFTEPQANAEKTRLGPQLFGAEIEEHEVQGEVD